MINNRHDFCSFAYKQERISDEETRALIAKAQQGNKKAMEDIVVKHLYIAALTAKKYYAYGIDLEDLQQFGSLTIVRCVSKYDITSPLKFCSYASIWVENEMKEYIFKNKSLIGIKDNGGHTIKKAFFKIRTALNNNEFDMKKACAEIGVKEEEGQAALNALYGHSDIYNDEGDVVFDCEVEDNTDEEIYTNQLSSKMHEMIGKLPEKERIILSERRLTETPATLATLAQRFGISGERVRQYEVRGMEKLTALAVGIQ